VIAPDSQTGGEETKEYLAAGLPTPRGRPPSRRAHAAASRTCRAASPASRVRLCLQSRVAVLQCACRGSVVAVAAVTNHHVRRRPYVRPPRACSFVFTARAVWQPMCPFPPVAAVRRAVTNRLCKVRHAARRLSGGVLPRGTTTSAPSPAAVIDARARPSAALRGIACAAAATARSRYLKRKAKSQQAS